MTTIEKTTSADVVARLYAALPVNYSGDCHTPETPIEKNSVWFILKNIDCDDCRSLCRAMWNDGKGISKMPESRWFEAIRLAGESLSNGSAIDLFKKAQRHLSFPKIVLTADDGTVCRIKRLTKGNHVGWLSIDNGKPFHDADNRWYGRIDPQGRFDRKRACSDDAAKLLTDFAHDPVAVAADQGKLTGNCRFCRRPLTDPRSTAVGYGLICSRHWGLPWG